MAKHANMIAALLRERDGYERQGKKDRVRQVDEQLEHYGYSPEPDEPKGRTASPQQTADQGTPTAKKTAAKKAAAAPPAPAAE
ncbi:hypothetical protein [Streptomyces cellulosae]|uniref:hypothetical protein n=1 Tax=Streptomyces cellulosae TaxID=1968 RepID=UPI00055F7D89|nr:hypothetical protein [Streptomyces cellulosae]